MNVERRAQEREPSVLPAEKQAPRMVSKRHVPTRQHHATLTRRERRVKEMLLKELARMSDVRTLTYAEIQHLEKGLNVEFIDAELSRMRRQYRILPRLLWGLAILFVILFGGMLWGHIADGTFSWKDMALLLPVFSGILSPFLQKRSLQRKIFIYEALRELSDADEMDVVLDRVVIEADTLIDRIVAMELQAEEQYPVRALRRVSTN